MKNGEGYPSPPHTLAVLGYFWDVVGYTTLEKSKYF